MTNKGATDLEQLLRDRQEALRPVIAPFDRTAIAWRLFGAFAGGFVIGLMVGQLLL